MAKLIACMLLTAWLIVALAVTVQSMKWFDRSLKTDKGGYWVNYAQNCVKELDGPRIRYRPASTIAWLKTIKGAPTKNECNDAELEHRMTQFAANPEHPKTNKFMQEYFDLYSNVCGLETRFATLISNFEQASDRQSAPENRQTLFSYLKSPNYKTVENQSSLLSAIKEKFAFDGVSGEIECADENISYFGNLIKNSEAYQDLHKLVKGYDKVYLDKCGYEARFQQAIGNIKQLSHKDWDSSIHATLYSYHMAKPLKPVELLEALSLIYEIFKPKSTPTETFCTQDNETSLLELSVSTRYDRYFQRFLDEYVKLYVDKCGLEDEYRKVVDFVDPESKDRDIRESLGRLIVSVDWPLEDIVQPIWFTRKLSGLISKLKDPDCSGELADDFRELLNRQQGRTLPYIENIFHPYVVLYLDKCGYEARLKETINRIDQVWPKRSHPPGFYPSLSTFSWLHVENLRGSFPDFLAALEVLFQFKGFSKETHCKMELISELVKHMNARRRLYAFQDLMLDHFAYYLDECGIERNFKRRFTKNESPDDSPLFEYLALYDFDHEKAWGDAVIEIIRELSKPESTQPGPDCPQELIENFRTISAKLRPDLYKNLEKYLAAYKDKCKGQSDDALA